MKSNFDFLQAEWPDLQDAASKAESLAHPDPRAACFYARRTLEQPELDELFATLQHRAFRGEL